MVRIERLEQQIQSTVNRSASLTVCEGRGAFESNTSTQSWLIGAKEG